MFVIVLDCHVFMTFMIIAVFIFYVVDVFFMQSN